MHRRRVCELQVLPGILGRHSPQLTAVVNRREIDGLLADATHDPLRTILDAREPVVAAGLDGLTDEDALLPHPPRDYAGIQLAVINPSLLDRVVDGVRLSVGTGNQRHPLAARVPLEVGVNHPLTGRIMVINPRNMPALRQFTSDRQRALSISRIAQPQRERRVLGIAEPMHRIELNRGIRVSDRGTHRTGMSDRQRLARVPDESEADPLLDRKFGECVHRLQIDHARFIDHDPIARTQHVPVGPPYVTPAPGSTSPTHSRVHTIAPA